MATERHFGPEIVDSQVGGQVVRDVKAATAIIVGTFPVHNVHASAAARAAHTNKSILVRNREQALATVGPDIAGYTLPWVLDAIFDQDYGQGVGTIEIINVFDPAVHKDAGGNPDPTKVTNLDIIGSFSASGQPSGLKHAYASFQRYGWFPKFVGTPGFTGVTGVRAELAIINNKIRARSYIDAPAGVTVAQVLAARGPTGDFDLQTNSRRLIPCYPHMRVVDTANAGATRDEPYSARLLGVHLRTIMENGYHHSPSNRAIEGIEEASQPILYVPGFSDDDTQLLRGAGVVTCEERWGKGPHTSGNRSAAFPTSTDIRNLIHVQFIEDMLDEAILFFLDEHKDRNASPAKLTYVEGLINAWGNSKTVGEDPELLGFRFWFDREKTTPQSYADGKINWKLKYCPVGIMEWLQVERGIDLELARDPLGLSASTTTATV